MQRVSQSNPDLTKSQRRVIEALQREGGSISHGYLPEYSGVSVYGITHVLNNLERKGLIRWGQDLGYDRGHDIHLTEAGERV